MKPVKPSELKTGIVHALPTFVIEAANELITKNFVGGRSVVLQKDLAKLIALKAGVATEEVYKSGWLNIEAAYSQDWNVVYDKPGYNESYQANFTFTEKRA